MQLRQMIAPYNFSEWEKKKKNHNKTLLPATSLTNCVSKKLMGLGEAAVNSQLCSFPLERTAAELIVSKALGFIQKPFAFLTGRGDGTENSTAFSLPFFFLFPSTLLLFCVLKWGLESGGCCPEHASVL